LNTSPTRRFTSRVDNYRKYRPGYPPEVIPYLVENAGLTPHSVIADVGAGTGLLTQLFLEHGNPVYAVEPNQAMRAVADELLNGYAHCHCAASTPSDKANPKQHKRADECNYYYAHACQDEPVIHKKELVMCTEEGERAKVIEGLV